METTAKVDLQKLQLLNDRIQQTIEALNLVRLSVHGLQAGVAGQVGIGQGIGQSIGGLAHTGMQDPRMLGQIGGWNQQMNPWAQQLGAYGQQGFGTQGYGTQGFVSPYGQPQFGQVGAIGGMGLGHSPYDVSNIARQVGLDPFTYARVVQTFPFVQQPVNPTIGTGQF